MISLETFLRISSGYVGSVARLRDDLWEQQAVFDGVLEEDENRYLVFNTPKWRRRFTSGVFQPYYATQIVEPVEAGTLFEETSCGREVYVAFAPSVKHAYLTKTKT